MSRPAKVTIDLVAAAANLATVRHFAPHSKILAVLKANAYGHGMIRVATALGDADAFGVCCIEEAMELRESGITKPILLMEGFFSRDELPEIARRRFDIVIHNFDQITELEQANLASPVRVWLKLDSGMHRLGITPTKFRDAWQRLRQISSLLELPILMSHFADSDELSRSATLSQLNCFNEITADLPGERSLSNTAAILAWPQTHADWVRPGGMLYGVTVFADRVGSEFGLKPVMTLSSGIIAIHQLHKGDAIGYGATWQCPEDMPVGVVALGYGDGYPRMAKNGTPVLVNGKIVPLVGRVSMDMLTVDLRTQPYAKVGNPVILWGEQLPVETIATCAGTSCYELICGISKRVMVTEVACHSREGA